MKILITGNYERNYNRTIILLEGLEKKGVELIEYPYKKFNSTIKKELKAKSLEADVVFIPSFLYRNVKEVKKVVSIPVIFDPLISIYMTKVFDKKTVWPYSPRALKNYWKDYSAFHSADFLFADTQAHKDYYVRTFKIAPKKIHVMPVGVNTEKFHPIAKKKNQPFRVGFYGSFLPLQGINNIIEAAKLLEDEDIIWEIIGDGFEYHRIKKMVTRNNLNKVILSGRLDYNKLNDAINTFDLSLGIFGASIKSNLVIPNKIYHYAACGQCVVTKDSPAIREVFTHNNNVILVKEMPTDIAEAIMQLKQDDNLRKNIGENARNLMLQKYSSNHIADIFIEGVKKNITIH